MSKFELTASFESSLTEREKRCIQDWLRYIDSSFKGILRRKVLVRHLENTFKTKFSTKDIQT